MILANCVCGQPRAASSLRRSRPGGNASAGMRSSSYMSTSPSMIILDTDNHDRLGCALSNQLDNETKLLVHPHGMLVAAPAFEFLVVQTFDLVKIPLIRRGSNREHQITECGDN